MVDISIFIYAIVSLVSVSIGWLLSAYKYAKYKIIQLKEREEMVEQLSSTRQQLIQNYHWRDECELCNNELRRLRDINSSLEADFREVTAHLKLTQIHAEEKMHQIINSEQRLSEQFENLANRIFERNNNQISEQNRQSLHGLLMPLCEQLDNFRLQVQNSFGQEACERHTLTHEIRNLQQLNTQMTQEAINLTRALKGNNKIQGNWGEIILTKVLEESGLREGYEYETQVSITTDSNTRVQPDVIIHLPQGKDVIVDAKMTLVAYESYFNTEDDCIRKSALQEHIASVRKHIRLLGRKNYQKLPGLCSLDYILMFIPIESAFLLAINKQPELINEALRNNIMLVSPTTLLVAVRTISNLWRYEHQSKNAQHIAKHASKLYNKMRLFVDDMLAIGQSLDHAKNHYHQAIKKLSSGRGNMLAQAEAFRRLGVEVQNEISLELEDDLQNKNKESHLCEKVHA